MPAIKQVYINIPQQEMLNIGGRTFQDVDDPATDSDGASSAASSRYSTSKGLRATPESRVPHKEGATKVPPLEATPAKTSPSARKRKPQDSQPSQEEAKRKSKEADKAERILRERMNRK